MPPKAKITKDMVIAAGFDIVRSEGQESLNVRKIAAKLECSTQPIMYHYKTVDELKADIYATADGFHTKYITTPNENAYDPLLSIGLNYIRFAEEERFLFRFLFQSDKFRNIGFREMLDGEEHDFLIQPLAKQTGLAPEQAKTVFETLFICVHGYASMLANNSMEYSEEHFAEILTTVFMGTIGFIMRGEEK